MRTVLLISLLGNALFSTIIVEQQRKLNAYEKYRQDMTTWSNLVVNAVKEHYKRGGTLDIPEEMVDGMEAFAIFVRNDLT